MLQLDPQALITLKETGTCQFELPEWTFDLDFPGHYFRRIKTLSLSIPCVAGPYTSVNATLTLLRSRTRRSTTTSTGYPWTQDFDDSRFDYDMGGAQSIATSSGQNDSGMFEFGFRDERYLPFEGAGTISTWRLELAEAFRPFDYSTIADVVLHLRYTARPGGEMLKTAATDALQVLINDAAAPPLARVFSLRHEFPSEWHRFLNPVSVTDDQALELDLRRRFPLMFQSTTSKITIAGVEVFVKAAAGVDFKLALKVKAANGGGDVTLAFDTAPPTGSTVAPLMRWEGLLKGTKSEISAAPGAWMLTVWHEPTSVTHERLDPSMIEEIHLVCQYTVTVTP